VTRLAIQAAQCAPKQDLGNDREGSKGGYERGAPIHDMIFGLFARFLNNYGTDE